MGYLKNSFCPEKKRGGLFRYKRSRSGDPMEKKKRRGVSIQVKENGKMTHKGDGIAAGQNREHGVQNLWIGEFSFRSTREEKEVSMRSQKKRGFDRGKNSK